jgi:uncharacterized protein (DUF4415 family)
MEPHISRSVRGKFYCPMKQSLTIRLDADVIAWFKSEGSGYQTRINSLLRNPAAMLIADMGEIE